MNATIREAAAEWLIEFRTDKPDTAARRRFAAWLRTSPEHISAYLEALALWEEASCYDKQHQLDIDTLLPLARTDRVVTEIREVDGPYASTDSLAPEALDSHVTDSPTSIRRRLLTSRTGIAALLSLAINCGLWWLATDSRNSGYTTQIAEQRSVVLSDGSHLDLDALSNVRVKFTSHERMVELVAGQALFRVTKNAMRPFVVIADGARLRAVGTKFDVNRTTMGTVITVLEGRVTVLASSPASRSLFGSPASWKTQDPVSSATSTAATVDAGQQVTILNGSVTAPKAIDTAAVTGWTRGLLIFASTPLPLVADELNRFNSRQLAIASPELVHVDVTGTFRASDPETLTNFVLLLRKQPGLQVLENANQITVQALWHPLPDLSLHM